MLKKKKTTASGKMVLVKSVRRTRSHRMKFCVQGGLGALPSTSKRRGKSQRDFLLRGPVCINTGIACRYYPEFSASDYLDLFVFRYSFRYSVGSTCVTSLNALENFPCVSYPT